MRLYLTRRPGERLEISFGQEKLVLEYLGNCQKEPLQIRLCISGSRSFEVWREEIAEARRKKPEAKGN